MIPTLLHKSVTCELISSSHIRYAAFPHEGWLDVSGILLHFCNNVASSYRRFCCWGSWERRRLIWLVGWSFKRSHVVSFQGVHWNTCWDVCRSWRFVKSGTAWSLATDSTHIQLCPVLVADASQKLLHFSNDPFVQCGHFCIAHHGDTILISSPQHLSDTIWIHQIRGHYFIAVITTVGDSLPSVLGHLDGFDSTLV